MIDLDAFFDEKEIPYTVWEIEKDGYINVIDSELVIENILESFGEERKQIGGVLFTLDLRNAPIIDYLHYLAKCLVANRYFRISKV